jgi:hypothetical protein
MPAHPRAKVVIASGYSFSGSSAYVDFLVDHEGVCQMPGGECRLFVSKYAFRSLLESIKSAGYATDEAIKHCISFMNGEVEDDTFYHGRIRTLVSALKAAMGDEYAMYLDRFETAVRARPNSGQAIIEASREFVHSTCDAIAAGAGAHTIVLDQGVRPWSLHGLRFFSQADVFVVRRDFRDQVIDRLCNGHPSEGFAAEMKRRVQAMKKQARTHGRADITISDLWFEDLVLNRVARARLRRQLGVGRRTGREFNPIASSRNVRLHEKRPDLTADMPRTPKSLHYRWTLRRSADRPDHANSRHAVVPG